MGHQQFTIINPSLSRSVKEPFSDDSDGRGGQHSDQMPKLRELREDVFFRAECLYLQNLVNLTGRNIRKACELSGLSRSRLYTLLKKYQITPPLTDHILQK